MLIVYIFCPYSKMQLKFCALELFFTIIISEVKMVRHINGCWAVYWLVKEHWPGIQKAWARFWTWLADAAASNVWVGVESQACWKRIQHVHIQTAAPASPQEEIPVPLTNDPRGSVWST